MSTLLSFKKKVGTSTDRRNLVKSFVQYWHSLKMLGKPPEEEQWIHAGLSHCNSVPMGYANIRLPVGNAAFLMDNIKILEQYTKLLGKACKDPESIIGQYLEGHVDSCTGNLEWFKPFLKTVSWVDCPTADKDAIQKLQAFGGFDREMVLSALMYSDMTLPGMKEYELHVANHIIQLQSNSCWDAFKTEFGTWRERGLLYSLIISSNYMTHLNDWIPVDYHLNEDVQAFSEIHQNIRESQGDAKKLTDILVKLAGLNCTSEPMQAIAHKLDQLAILMRVHTRFHTKTPCLDDLLLTFPEFEKASIGEVWDQLKSSLENVMPPSILAPTPFKTLSKSTWVRGPLKFRVLLSKLSVQFSDSPLEWKAALSTQKATRFKLENGVTSSRLKDVIQRTGSILTSPELACVVLYPSCIKSQLAGVPLDFTAESQLCNNPPSLLFKMGTGAACLSDDAFHDFQKAWPESKQTVYRTPRHVIAWKVEMPQRTILFTGNAKHVLADRFTPHLLEKTILEHRVSFKAPERIHISSDLHDHVIRDSLLHHVQTTYTDGFHRETKEAGGHTALEEALTCWIREPPSLHTNIALNTSVQWDSSHEDPRYAETQEGLNGYRYRDWVTMYADSIHIQKCKLDSHVISFDQVYQNQFPWCLDELANTTGFEWVSVSSTLPVSPIVLRNRNPEKSNFDALSTAIKSRFMQDLSILPVRGADDKVEKQNVNVYTDPTCGQVLLVYAPTSSDQTGKQLEFVSFKCFSK